MATETTKIFPEVEETEIRKTSLKFSSLLLKGEFESSCELITKEDLTLAVQEVRNSLSEDLKNGNKKTAKFLFGKDLESVKNISDKEFYAAILNKTIDEQFKELLKNAKSKTLGIIKIDETSGYIVSSIAFPGFTGETISAYDVCLVKKEEGHWKIGLREDQKNLGNAFLIQQMSQGVRTPGGKMKK
jgi:2-hydroxy-3-keto-5-methylthiopentenyl-1-phosphate phosphatase